jgi:hypothetical protein
VSDPLDAYFKRVNLLRWPRILERLRIRQKQVPETYDLLVPCPFHPECPDAKNELQLFLNGTFGGCYACQETGDVFRFIHAVKRGPHDPDYARTYQFIETAFGVPSPRKRPKR